MSGIRQAVVTCRRGTSVARSLKLFALPYSNSKRTYIIKQRHYIYSSSTGDLPYVTNTN